MKKGNKKPQKREYFILEEWLAALQRIDGFSLLAIEFKKKTCGYVKQIKGQVFVESEKYIANIKITEKHAITVIWNHMGVCTNTKRTRMEEFDVTQYLEH